MGVASGVAVTRKMFCGSQRAVFLDSADELFYELSDARRIFPEGSRVDDGIVGIIVNVSVRGVDPLNADRARFQRRYLTHGVGVARISRSRERHCGWKGRALVETHSGAAFEISTDQKRQFRFAL